MFPVSDDLLTAVCAQFEPVGGAVSGAQPFVSTTITVSDRPDPVAVAATGVAILDSALASQEINEVWHAAVEVMTVDEADRRLGEPTPGNRQS